MVSDKAIHKAFRNKLYKHNQLERFFFFTIYQNYTMYIGLNLWFLKLYIDDKNWSHQCCVDAGCGESSAWGEASEGDREPPLTIRHRLHRWLHDQHDAYQQHHRGRSHPGGGGGYSPQILVGTCMCRGKVKYWQGLWNERPVERESGAPEQAWAVLSVKMRGSGTSLVRFECENVNLRNGR